jgi:hypothetical protein
MQAPGMTFASSPTPCEKERIPIASDCPAKFVFAKLQYSILWISVQHDLRIFADQSRVTRTGFSLCNPPMVAVDDLVIYSLTLGEPQKRRHELNSIAVILIRDYDLLRNVFFRRTSRRETVHSSGAGTKAKKAPASTSQ